MLKAIDFMYLIRDVMPEIGLVMNYIGDDKTCSDQFMQSIVDVMLLAVVVME